MESVLARRLALVLILALPAPAASAQEVLPDLAQVEPTDVAVQAGATAGTWRLGFTSRVNNVGPGPLHIEGNGSGIAGEPMQADQIVQGAAAPYEDVAQLDYVDLPEHEHWHITPFSRYTLSGDAGDVLDVKQGFCLVALVANDYCGQNDTTLTQLTMGIASGFNDAYAAFIEGQYIPISPGVTPNGEYDLVHETNWSGWLHESSLANNSASVRLKLTWPADPLGAPAVELCPCAPDAPPPPAETPPPPPPPAETPPPPPAPALDLGVTMSRSSAIELSKQAFRRELKGARRVRAACTRREKMAFSCRMASSKGRGQVGVWYVLEGTSLRWIYNVRAGRLRRLRVDGGERLASAAGAKGPAFVCRIRS